MTTTLKSIFYNYKLTIVSALIGSLTLVSLMDPTRGLTIAGTSVAVFGAATVWDKYTSG